MLHQEAHGITAFTATEAFEDVSGGIYVEGRRTLAVERAQADQVYPPSLKGNEFADHVFNSRGIEYILNLLRRDHICKSTEKIGEFGSIPLLEYTILQHPSVNTKYMIEKLDIGKLPASIVNGSAETFSLIRSWAASAKKHQFIVYG